MFLVWIFAVILYFIKRKFFKEHQGIAEFSAVIISLIFTLFALNQAQSSIDQSTEDFSSLIARIDTIVTNVNSATNSIDAVKLSLSDLPSRIDTFAISIDSLNAVVTTQKKQFGQALNDFSLSIEAFQKSVDDMSERFNRKPDLRVSFDDDETDSTIHIKTIVITNYGTLTAELYTVKLYVPKTSILNFEWTGSKKDQEYEDYTTYYQEFQEDYVFADTLKHKIFRCNILLSKRKSFEFKVIVYYRANFGHDGTSDWKFVWDAGNDNSESKKIFK